MDDIFTSYNNIRNKKNVSFEDLKLLRLVKAEGKKNYNKNEVINYEKKL